MFLGSQEEVRTWFASCIVGLILSVIAMHLFDGIIDTISGIALGLCILFLVGIKIEKSKCKNILEELQQEQMTFEQKLEKIKRCLVRLNKEAKHAIRLKEMFTFPANDKEYHKTINGTNKVYCWSICIGSIYLDFVMTITRMFDTTDRDTECFKKIFEYLSDDFVKELESRNKKQVKPKIEGALKGYKVLKGSHYVGRIKTTRNEIYAHPASVVDENQTARIGHAEDLLKETLPMLNQLNLAINSLEENYDCLQKEWKGFSTEFWKNAKPS